jgi:hypothetical protein
MQRIRCQVVGAIIVAALILPITVAAQEDVFSVEELDQMLAPVALHPDALLSQMLMAATYPMDVAEAVRWSAANPGQEGDAAVAAVQDQPWDPSVMSLVAFPQVLAMMGEQADWVKDLGDAFLADPERLLERVQYLRQKADEAGYLESNEHQSVSFEDPPPPLETSTSTQTTVVVEQAPQTIIIEQPDPQIIYVPAYDPMVVYGVWWWPRYRPWFWRPVGWGFGGAVWRGIGFGIGIGITNSLWGGFRWGNRSVNVNVNRFNNINVNNRISSNNRNVNWNHNPDRRRNAPYRDNRSRQQFDTRREQANLRDRADRAGGGAGVGERDRAGNRQDFRGRDSQRDAAQRALSDRGADPARARDQLRNDAGTRERAQASTRDMNRNQARANAQQRERGQVRKSQSTNNRSRDTALRGVDRPSGNRQAASRGQVSRGGGRRGGAQRGGGRGGAGGGRRR